jgi:hypothetical protein
MSGLGPLNMMTNWHEDGKTIKLTVPHISLRVTVCVLSNTFFIIPTFRHCII